MGVTHACNWGQIRLGRPTWRARRLSRRASLGGLSMPEAARPATASPIGDGGTVYGRSRRAPRLPLREGLGVFSEKREQDRGRWESNAACFEASRDEAEGARGEKQV
jgi:hypothetical protein